MDAIQKIYKYCPTCKHDLQRKMVQDEKILACENCGFIFWNNPKPVVSFLLQKGGKILMLQRANEPLKDYWCFPGGFMRYNETPQEAVKREVTEETGLDVLITDLVGVYRIDNDPRGIHIDIIYSGTSSGKITLSSEDQRFAWYEPQSLPPLVAYKHREAITDWLTKRK